MSDEKSSYLNMTALDKKLRVAEISLQQEETGVAEKSPDNKLVENLGDSVGNVDKIRDILFGGYIRDYERRFKRLEDRLTQEGAHLRDDMSQRLKALEELLDNELDSLSEKNKAERQERQLSYQDLKQEIQATKSELTQRLNQLDEQFAKDVKQLRQYLQTKLQELTSQLRQQNDTLTALFKQEITQLHEEKVSRGDLASFFNEFALRLTKSFNLPPT